MTDGTLFVAVEFAREGTDPARLKRLVALAEDAGVALLTFADHPAAAPARGGDGRLEAGVRAGLVATTTTRIGLAPALPVTTTEPFHLATQLATLDHATHGRAAWLVEAPNDAGARATVGERPLAAPELEREIRDVVDVARALWDSWEDDAVIRDTATGRYLDAGRVHHVNFEGARFGVTGPLITPRPPQGQVVVIARQELGLGDRADIVLIKDGEDLATRADAARAAGARLVVADVGVSLPGAVSALDLAGRLTELKGVVDGVRLRPESLLADLPLIADTVLPTLGAVLRRPAGHETLRDFLRLGRPASRFATT